MLLFHLRALRQQLEQAYVGMAVAAAAGRAFILPQVRRGWQAGQPGLRAGQPRIAGRAAEGCGQGSRQGGNAGIVCHAPLQLASRFLLSPTAWRTVHRLHQLLALRRSLPPSAQFQCFCQNADKALPRCRRPGSGELQFPAPCPEGDILMPLSEFGSGGEAQGMPLQVEPDSAARGIESVSCGGREGCITWLLDRFGSSGHSTWLGAR